MGVRVDDAHEVPALVLDLLEHLELLLAVQPVGQVALVGVRHREEVLRLANAIFHGARQQPAGLVRQPGQRMGHQLITDVCWDLDSQRREFYRDDRIPPRPGGSAVRPPRDLDRPHSPGADLADPGARADPVLLESRGQGSGALERDGDEQAAARLCVGQHQPFDLVGGAPLIGHRTTRATPSHREC